MEIIINTQKRTAKIVTAVKDSLHGSIFSDKLNALPYLKVIERKYQDHKVSVFCHTIKKEFTIERLHTDLELINL